MHLRQKLLLFRLFLSRLERFWTILIQCAWLYALLIVTVYLQFILDYSIRLSGLLEWLSSVTWLSAVVSAVGARLPGFFEYYWLVITLLDGADWLSIFIPAIIFLGALAVYVVYTGIEYAGMEDVDYQKPSQPLKLRRLGLPKKANSLNMWISDTPYTALFMLIVILWLAFCGWLFWQSGPSVNNIYIASTTLVLLGSVYVFCVLAQGYRDFCNNNEWALEAVSKQHAPMPPPISIWKILVITTMVTIGIALVVAAFVAIYMYW